MSDEEIKKDDSVESEDVVEFEFNEDGEEDLKKTLKKLRADLKACKEQKEEYLLGWQKERADFANYKKGEGDRNKMFRGAAEERVLDSFLSVLDSFNMAFANQDAWQKVDEGWRKGVEYIYSQMNKIFEEYGVTELGKEGEAFDPNIHESVETVNTEKKDDDHKIAKVIQKGYKLNQNVLRPAKVTVYEYKNGTE